MQHTDAIRSEILKRLKDVPFRRFVIRLENGERALIEHPENVAYDPEPGGADDFYVVTGKLRLFSAFAKVTGILLADLGGVAA